MKKRQVVVKKISSKPGSTSGSTTQRVRYVECQKNHAASIGGYAVDGCREFMAGGAEGGTVMCAACGCHRNFHRREVISDGVSFEGNSST